MAKSSTTIVHTIREFGRCLNSCLLSIILGESYLRLLAHLPFGRTFPETYPEFLTKDHLAVGYINWTKKYGIVSSNLALVTQYLC